MKRWQPYAALVFCFGAALSAASGCELIASADRSLIGAAGAGGGQGGSGGAGGTGGEATGMGGMGGTGGMAGMGGSGGMLLTNGSPCTMPAECSSGFCVDGVCCDTACDGTCVACTAALQGGTDGTCGPIAAGSDPENECDDETGTNACGQTGNCDGGGFCEVVAGGTSCGDIAECVGGTQTGADLCDGLGACVDGGSMMCDPYVCDAGGAMCLTMCSGNADCMSTHYCLAGTCVMDKPTGQACAAPEECQSGFCADGFCCNTACDATCQACSMAKKGSGANGTCGPINPGTDPDNECGTECMISNCNQASMCSASQPAPDGTPCGMGMMCTGGVCQ